MVTLTDLPSGLANFPFLGDNGRSYTTYGKYLAEATHEEDLVEEFTGFRSQQEVWSYLAGGGYVTFREELLAFWEGSLSRFNIYGEFLATDKSYWCFKDPEDWSVASLQTKPEPKWYDNIPKQGILCWVKDEEEDVAELVTISSYRPNAPAFKFEGIECYWKHATPATLEEITNYIYKVE